MGVRQCLQCGGELVMAVRPNRRSNLGGENLLKPMTQWRCGTCGESFTAEQLRIDKRAKPVQQA